MNYNATGASFKYNYVNEIAEEINCEKSCSFREIVKTECGPSRGVEGNVLVAECMNDITSHLASCHLSKCSKCSKDNENELILARVRIRGLVGIRN